MTFPTSLAKEMKEAVSSPSITVEVEQKIQITETEIEEEIELPLPVQEFAVKRVDGKDFIEFIFFSSLSVVLLLSPLTPLILSENPSPTTFNVISFYPPPTRLESVRNG